MKKVFHSIAEYIKYSDKLLIFYCTAISAFGIIMMLSLLNNQIIITQKQVFIQGFAIGMGILIAILVSLIDYHFLASMWKILVPLALIVTLITFIPGVAYIPPGTDDKAWLNLFGITTFQPSELLKIAFILSFSLHLSKIKNEINRPLNILLLLLHGLAPMLIIQLQGDTGTALIFLMIFLSMLFVSGISWRYIVAAIISLGALIPFTWFFILTNNQRNRFMIVLNPELDPLGIGLQQIQGRISMGAGQLFGKGLFSGDLVNNVPYVHNDFIFSYIGQTLGFVGCFGVVVLIALICIKILLVARMSKDDLGAFICVGVFAVFLFQTIINIGMVLVVLPVIGVTLPFLSAGGTSIVTSFLAIGLVLGVYYKNKKRGFFED